jgi:lipoprotein-releasing system permease protein
MRTIFFIALRHLITRRRQTFVAIFGMGISVTVLVGMTGLMKGFEHKFLGETLKVSPHVSVTEEELMPPDPIAMRALGKGVLAEIHHERPRDRAPHIKRPRDVVEAALKIPGVLTGAKQIIGQSILAFADKTYPVELRGIEPELQDTVTPIRGYIVKGRFDALDTVPDAVMLGSGVADRIGANVGDKITAAGPGGTRITLKVVAIFDTGIPPVDKVRAFSTLRTAQNVLERPDEVNSIGFRLDDTERAPEIAQVIGRIAGYRTESWQEQNANWLGIFAFQQMVTRLVVFFLLVVAAFGILNILIMIVLEKTRDIAILRSVGLTRDQILRIFVLQGFLMGIAGALLGCVMGRALVWGVQQIPVKLEGLIKTDRISMWVEPWYYLAACGFAMAAGIIASIIPARRAARTEPVDVLRGQV